MMSGVIDDVRVPDLFAEVAGPVAGMLPTDVGAEIESGRARRARKLED